MKTDNIAAIATPAGAGGVAVIRISGSTPLELAKKIFKPFGKTPVESFVPNMMYLGEICADGFTDEGFCVYFKAPKSYTGEDTVELHCHGGAAITQGILHKLTELGVNPAGKGDFTRRAFLNGKMSLSSAEGLIGMINSESQAQVRAGYSLYRENLKRKAENMQEVLTDILAEIDANIDFPEDGVQPYKLELIESKLRVCAAELAVLLSGYKTGRIIKSGVNVAIAGRPNTGKSSLLNCLTDSDRAIVSDTPGTTRDIVEGAISIDGIKFNLYDTAGIRQSGDKIEQLGVERSEKMLGSADLVIFVLDATDKLSADDYSIMKRIEGKNKITVFNKTDKKRVILTGGVDLLISAKTGENIDKLKKMMYDKTVGKIDAGGEVLTEERHYNAFKEAKNHLDCAIIGIKNQPLDLLTVDIKSAWSSLGEISGMTASEDIINRIFAKFCVGK